MTETIFVISPQPWDGFKVSKHHYARSLAERGKQVYFLDNSLAPGVMGNIVVEPVDVPGVHVVRHQGFFLRWLKFRCRPFYDRLSRWHAGRIIKAIGARPDVVWDLDNNYHFPDLRVFGAQLNIFHPVDSLMAGQASDKHADAVFAVDQRFIDRLETDVTTRAVIPHGLNHVHASYARSVINRTAPSPDPSRTRPRIGYVANLDIPGIDWPTITAMIAGHPEADFHFIGPYGCDTPKTGPKMPVAELAAAANVTLHGLLPIEDVVAAADQIDIWMLCNDRAIRPDGGVNAHKLLEYLATGKAVLANSIDAFEGSDLLTMAPKAGNASMPAILSGMLGSLDRLNSQPEMERRAAHALSHSYESNLDMMADKLATANLPHAWARAIDPVTPSLNREAMIA